ncbi:MAG: 3-dehydroquinate synthase [Mangrovibacterium sp.]
MKASKIQANIIFSQQVTEELQKIVSSYPNNQVFLLTETTPHELCLPRIQQVIDENNIHVICIEGGENNKTIASCEQVWQALSAHGADRKSLLINIGGGVITDLGGFVASTFKRGIDFVNIPTTLLSQVDASLGGKTGVNFNGLKNEIGVFNEPVAVIIDTNFLRTIDHANVLSGYAEMIKHGLIKSEQHLEELKKFDLEQLDYVELERLIAQSNAIKEWHVVNDFRESGIRKALNFGHTVGHAFESFALHDGRPILHGHAVVYGMLVELYLSTKLCGFSEQDFQTLCSWLTDIYGKFEIEEKDYDELFELMTHDKKNSAGQINFTLLNAIGEVQINQHCEAEMLRSAVAYYQQL